MKLLKTFLTLLLVTVWLPLTSHALLENAELIHQHHGATDSPSHTDNHDAADGHCRVESNQIQVPHAEQGGLSRPLETAGLSRSLAVLDEAASQLGSGLPPPGTAPPQLSHRWQFSFRTALPARAPSLIS